MLHPLHHLLHAQAAARPDALALIGVKDSLSFAGLMSAITRVAGSVAARTRPGATVLTLLDHSPHAVAAVLGCHAAGRIAVPLGAGEPAARVDAILEETVPDLVIDAAGSHGRLALTTALDGPPLAAWPASPDPDSVAFVYFTSGSSGRPKGIAISHLAATSRAMTCHRRHAFTQSDRLLAPPSHTSSAGLTHLVAALHGGSACLVADLRTEGAGAMIRLARNTPPNIFIGNSSAYGLLHRIDARVFDHLRCFRVGAMELLADQYQAWRAGLPPACEMVFTYASTEALVMSDWSIPADFVPSTVRMPIGHFVTGPVFRLIDDSGATPPDGVAGQLVVHRRDMAVGEWQRGQLVAGRMAPDPGRPGWRVFHTGDMIRRDADGLLHFAGRADRQIKINGVRIEPSEIEAVLRAAAGVSDCVVLATGGAKSPRLQAFIAGDIPREAITAHARAALPRAMQPARITLLAALPTLPSGKTDVQALLRIGETQSPEA